MKGLIRSHPPQRGNPFFRLTDNGISAFKSGSSVLSVICNSICMVGKVKGLPISVRLVNCLGRGIAPLGWLTAIVLGSLPSLQRCYKYSSVPALFQCPSAAVGR